MNIRYANKSDKEWIKNSLLKDPESRTKLNIKGSDEGDIIRVDDRWGATFIGEEKEKQRGVITVSYNASNNFVYLNDIYIEKEYRRKGMAKQLLEFAMKYSFDNWGGIGIYAFTLENKRMDKFLKKYGFIKRGTYNDFVKRGNSWINQTYWLKKYDKT